MKYYEYAVIEHEKTAEDERTVLNERAREGWEFVTAVVLAGSGSTRLYFKRPTFSSRTK